MPYVHEDQGHDSVSLNQEEEDYIEDQEEDYQEPRRSVGLVVQRSSGGGNPIRTYSVVSGSPSTATTASQLALQRRAAQRKLQMAKMMGNGGMASTMNFHRVVAQHSAAQAQQQQQDRHDQNDAMYVASRRARSNNFTLKETFDLLKIWASPEMQWQMKHNFRNFRVWEAISYSMHEMGHDRTAIQCKNRIQNLTSIFYRIKKSKQDYRSFNFPYYKLIGEVLDGKKNGTAAMGAIELSPALAKFATNYSGGSNGIMGNSHSNNTNSNSGRIAAHMALVEEYQHLINGNPETNITSFTERNSSSNGSSSMNVLSPEVSLSEGNSPIRMEAQAGGSRSSQANKPSQNSSPSNPKANGVTTMSFVSRNGGNSTNPAVKLDEDNVTITVEDGSLPDEHEQDIEASDYDDSYMGAGDESPSGRNGGLPGVRGVKRSFSSSFNPYVKTEYARGGGVVVGNAAKRPRVASTATNASSTQMDDPIGNYLSEMVDIERQWLEMERERAENERAMMMYMMQILQAIVCPSQSQEEEAEGEEEGTETEVDRDVTENETEFADGTEQDADDNEIRQMIEDQEEEENQLPNGEPEEND